MANEIKCENALCNIIGHDENDLSMMFAIMLKYNETLLKEFLNYVKVPQFDEIDKIIIETQPKHIEGKPDIKISLKNKFKIIIEVKLELRPKDSEQLERYANEILTPDKGSFSIVKLIFLTKYDEEWIYYDFLSKKILNDDESFYFRWTKNVKEKISIYDLMEKSLDSKSINKDFLDYVDELATPPDFYVGIIRSKEKWSELETTLTYQYEPDPQKLAFILDRESSNDYNQLRDYLEKNHNLNWVKTANINEAENGNIIEISDGTNEIQIRFENNIKATLIINNNTINFRVQTDNNKLSFYELFRSHTIYNAEYFLPYKMKGTFGDESGIYNYGKIKQVDLVNNIIKIDKLSKLPYPIKVEDVKLSYAKTTLEILRKAIFIEKVDPQHRLQKKEDWINVPNILMEDKDKVKWEVLRNWTPEE